MTCVQQFVKPCGELSVECGSFRFGEIVRTAIGWQAVMGEPERSLFFPSFHDREGNRIREAGGDEIGAAPLPPVGEIEPVPVNGFIPVVRSEGHG